MKRYDRSFTPKEIGAVRDEDIDFIAILELSEDFRRNAEVVELDEEQQAALCRDLLFPERKPNAETLEAMCQVATGEGLIECDGVQGMIAECERDDE